MATRLETIRKIRLEKLQKLRKLGIEPYPAQSSKDYSNKEIVDNFTKFEGKTVHVAGRLMNWREHGKVIFGDIADEYGKLQLVLKQDVLSLTEKQKQTIGFADLEFLDVGDFVQAEGEIIKTKTGEISVLVKSLRLLVKALRPLPEKWEGLKDREIIFRRRYLDLTMSPQRREMFRRKAKFWEVQRRFMKDNGFMEVETPVRSEEHTSEIQS